MLALASLYGLSDEQVEYQVKDRLSFMRIWPLPETQPQFCVLQS